MAKILIVFFLSMSFIAVNVVAEPVSTGRLNNIAIGQHDVTEYHRGTAATGDKRFVHNWKGADWYFAEEAQRDLFAANPDKYSPAYNGFCSNALTLNEGLIRTDGSVWHIFEDQLHLFFAERGRQRWINGDYQSLKAQADAAWTEETESYN